MSTSVNTSGDSVIEPLAVLCGGSNGYFDGAHANLTNLQRTVHGPILTVAGDSVHSLVGIQSTPKPREGEKTKRRIIDAAYELFYKSGFARAGVDAIAEAAQVTKRTLYYHFDSKDSLMAAVLDAQSELAMQRIERWAKRARGDPARVVEIVFAEFEAWAKHPAWQGSGFSRAAMETGRSSGASRACRCAPP